MSNRYRETRFILSAYELRQLPADQGREVAFAGRSNSGKSSALNAITGQKSLARTSKTPGRTQLINLFQVTPGCHLVDLPGYGYAKVPNALRRHWQQTLVRYLSERQALRGLFLTMDLRHPLTDSDRQMLEWCGAHQVLCHLLLTKADKLRRGPALATLQRTRATLDRYYPHASAQLFSAFKHTGIECAHRRLDQWLGYSDFA